MSLRRSLRRALLGVSLGLLVSPVPAMAQSQSAVLFEVTETMKLRGPAARPHRRVATAALMGTTGAGPICPIPGVRCGVTAIAGNAIDLATGLGRVKGNFWVVVQGDNPADGPEFVIFRGEIDGDMDLSRSVAGVAPLGTLEGKWSARGVGPLAGVRLGGPVSGVFRLPTFLPPDCADDGDPSDCAPGAFSFPGVFYDAAPAPQFLPPNFVEVRPDAEYSLNVPTVRLELTFRVGR